MTVYAANLKFDRANKTSIAKSMFNYFLAQYESAIRQQVIGNAELSSMNAANTEFQRHDDFGGGFSNNPYSDAQIKHKEQTLEELDEQVKDAEAIIKFMRDRFLFGLV